MSENKEDFWTKNSVGFAFILVIIGFIIILTFLFRSPFNDWSWVTDATLFGQFGDFIGGFIGTLFSLAGFFLIYKTLLAQQQAIKQQENNSDNVSFETTFFNLLHNQQEITNNIKAYFKSINGLTDERIQKFEGREFFMYSVHELKKINDSVFSSTFLGIYDRKDMEHWGHYIDELYDPSSTNYTHPDEAAEEEENAIKNARIKYANKFYGITSKQWNNIHDKSMEERISFVYKMFLRRFHYVIGHYFRNIYHILNFIEQHELSQIAKTNEVSKHEIIRNNCNKYAQFIQAQMSSYELTLLYYNALCFPKSLRLITKYNLLENLSVEDLIDPSHNLNDKLKLKSREEILGF
jgi:hypothetical protein